MYLQGIEREGADGIDPAQDREKWWAVLNEVVNFRSLSDKGTGGGHLLVL
jgi:hypothetical protein